ncbi:hypothetical protein NE865_04616 [Phthorimaea operculella]|nr:hypothetical protein NE865_04616 [Phthorimaea operculella]
MRLIILLALLVGVLYCLHLLVRDYQSLSAGRLFSFLSKRDIHAQQRSKPTVRWKKILQYDPLHCARSLYCDIGARPVDSEIRRGFTIMLTLEPREEDMSAQEEFIRAYNYGHQYGTDQCRRQYLLCPFKPALLFEVVQFLLRNPSAIMDEPPNNFKMP